VSIRFVLVPPSELGPYVEGLRAIERATRYPIGDSDHFTIDHGAEYHPFFSTLGHDPRFLVGLDGDKVIGGVVGMYRDVCIRGRVVRGVYGADWKLAPEYRGRGVASKMLSWGASRIFTDSTLLGWRYAWVAAMKGAHGDVMRTVKGMHIGKLAHPAGTLAVYFVDPARLAALHTDDAPLPPAQDDGIDLSHQVAGSVEPPGLVSTAGRKDLRLESTGAPWPLVHLPYGPGHWRPSWGAYLAACGARLAATPAGQGSTEPAGTVACFSIDERLTSHISWLAAKGVEPSASCTVYAFDLTMRARRAKWLHLATSEI
jgi:hypothetical protein